MGGQAVRVQTFNEPTAVIVTTMAVTSQPHPPLMRANLNGRIVHGYYAQRIVGRNTIPTFVEVLPNGQTRAYDLRNVREQHRRNQDRDAAMAAGGAGIAMLLCCCCCLGPY